MLTSGAAARAFADETEARATGRRGDHSSAIQWLLTCAALIAVPVLGLWMTRASIANFNARWLTELAAATGPIPPDRLDLVRLPALCANSTLQVEISSACADLHLSTALDLLVVITLACRWDCS